MKFSILSFLLVFDILIYNAYPEKYLIHDEIVDQIWNGENPIVYAQNRFIDDNYPHTHIKPVVIEAILRYVKPSFWLEVGSMLGGSAILAANQMKKLNMNTSVVCVDPFTGQICMGILIKYLLFSAGDVNMLSWEKEKAKKKEWRYVHYEKGQPTIYERFRANIMKAQHQNSIVPIVATSMVGLKLIRHLKSTNRISALPEVIYLDSAHEETETLMELHLAWQLLPVGGILFGDDFEWLAVNLDVRKFSKHLKHWKRYDVQKTRELQASLPGSHFHLEDGNDAIIVFDGQWILVKKN